MATRTTTAPRSRSDSHLLPTAAATPQAKPDVTCNLFDWSKPDWLPVSQLKRQQSLDDEFAAEESSTGPMLIEIRTVDIYRLVDVNDAAGTFNGQIYIEMALPGKAKDPHLAALHPDKGPYPYFPYVKDQSGRKDTRTPTFKPNAEWFLDQIGFDNLIAGSQTRMDSKCMIVEDDIIMSLYVEGDFLETLELYSFPFDAQDLTFTMSLNCQSNGKWPCRFVPRPEGTKGHIARPGFFLDHQWSLEEYKKEHGQEIGPRFVHIQDGVLGPDGSDFQGARSFPTLRISVKVRRRPQYYNINVIVPAQMIVLFAASPLSLPLSDLSSRTEIVVGLLITFQLFKFGVLGNILPHVSYETLLDISIHNALYIVSGMALENFVMVACSRVPALKRPRAQLYYFEPLCMTEPEDSDFESGADSAPQPGCTVLEIVDVACFFIFLVLWVLSMLWLYWKKREADQQGTDLEEKPPEELRTDRHRASTMAWASMEQGVYRSKRGSFTKGVVGLKKAVQSAPTIVQWGSRSTERHSSSDGI